MSQLELTTGKDPAWVQKLREAAAIFREEERIYEIPSRDADGLRCQWMLEAEAALLDAPGAKRWDNLAVQTAIDFDAFWSVYPRKASKAGARKAWDKAVKKTNPRAIIAGAERYRDDPNRVDEFTKHAPTWLNGECWDDEPLPPRGRSKDSPMSQTARVAALMNGGGR